jgi:hypothetical protein
MFFTKMSVQIPLDVKIKQVEEETGIEINIMTEEDMAMIVMSKFFRFVKLFTLLIFS